MRKEKQATNFGMIPKHASSDTFYHAPRRVNVFSENLNATQTDFKGQKNLLVV